MRLSFVLPLVSAATLAPLAALGDGVKLGLVEVRGFVDVSATFNPNQPANGSNFTEGTGTTAKRANELSVNLAAITFTLPPAPVGLTLGFNVGTGPDVLYSGEVVAPGTSPSVWRFVREASVSWKATGRLLLQAGLYPSHVGLESMASRESWMYTRSWMGEFSPYYQAGLKAAYAFSDEWSGQLHVVNGWNAVGDVNTGKTLGAQVLWARGKTSIALNGLVGPEQPNDNTHLRALVDLVVQVPLGERLALQVCADLGREGQADGSVKSWRALQALARVPLAETVALLGRGEIFADPDGGISGAGQTLLEGAAALEVHPAGTLLVKLEARADHSTAAVFTKRAGRTDAQVLVSLGIVASF